MKIDVNGQIINSRYLDKYTRHFINLDLKTWNLEKGRGKLILDLKRKKDGYYVNSNVELRDFTSSGQPIQSLQGIVKSEKGITRADMIFQDPQLQGKGMVYTDDNQVRIDFKNVKGESQKVMKILGYDISLFGAMSGDFLFLSKDGDTSPLVEGTFKAGLINFYDFNFVGVSGKLEARDYILAEAKCGEGKCGGEKAAEGKCGEGKCGGKK